jgi:hypothetical protein
MPKKRPLKHLQEYHGNAADPTWWRKALKRHKSGQAYPERLTAAEFTGLITAYLEGEIPAAIFGVSFLRAFAYHEGLNQKIVDLLWSVKGLASRLPGFDDCDDVFELPESVVKAELTPLLAELRRTLAQEPWPEPPVG